MMQVMVSRSEQAMTDVRDDQIDFERVIMDPEYRRHVIVYLNAQARGRDSLRGTAGIRSGAFGKSHRAEVVPYPLLRRLG
jgi:hypothetical protein